MKKLFLFKFISYGINFTCAHCTCLCCVKMFAPGNLKIYLGYKGDRFGPSVPIMGTF